MNNRILKIYRGLPGCGKSTAAKALMAANPRIPMVRLNNDDLCTAVYNTVNVGAGGVTDARMTLLDLFMAQGKYILLDNTNLPQTRIDEYSAIVERFNKEKPEAEKYSVVIEDLRFVPMWLCHERNNKRKTPVPPRVITDMFRTHILPLLKGRNQNPDLPSCAVIDIDGTVSRMCNRSPYDYTKYELDTPYLEIWKQISTICNTLGYQQVFLTGRSEIGREETLKWLHANLGLTNPILHMRGDHDHRSDFIFKEEKAVNDIMSIYNIKAWFEDRLRNVEMARYNLGIEAVYQLNEGSF